MYLLLVLVSCDEPDGADKHDLGKWVQIRPPPDAPAGMKCSAWMSGYVGGPVCYVPGSICLVPSISETKEGGSE